MSSTTDSNAIISLLTGREPSYNDRHDAVMFALHTHMLRKQFMCVSIGTDRESTRELSSVPNGWNANRDAYQFHYIHSENPELKVSLNGVKMDKSLIVNALAGTIQSPISLEVNVEDFTNADADLKNFRALYKDLAGLLALFDSQILSKIMPSNNQAKQSITQQSTVQHDPLRVGEPRRPQAYYEDDDDANRMADPRYRRRGDFDGDLNPLGGVPTGNLMGPRNFPFGGAGRGNAPEGIPGMAPRFDPYGPMPGMGDPDFDELLPPGPGGVPTMNPNRRGPRPPFGGPGGFGGGFPPGPGGFM